MKIPATAILFLSLFACSGSPAQDVLDNMVQETQKREAQKNRRNEERERKNIGKPAPVADEVIRAEAVAICARKPGPERDEAMQALRNKYLLSEFRCETKKSAGVLNEANKDAVPPETWSEFVRLCKLPDFEKQVPELLKGYDFEGAECPARE